MELFFLGTGAGVPSKGRNVSSVALSMLNERNAIWLFDCGEATQHQILKSPVKLGKINTIFITHMHGDHIFGLPGLLSSRSFQGGESELFIYGPKGIEAFIRQSLELSASRLTYPLTVVELENEGSFQKDDIYIHYAELYHGVKSYGYRLEEADKAGALDAERLKEEGVTPGPLFSRLKKGEQVMLPDGRMIDGKDYIGAPQKGKIVAIFGDTRQTEAELDLAHGADVVVHEATFSGDKKELAHEYWHSTTYEAATLAEKAEAKQLILTHISSRYDKEASKELLLEAREIFPNTEMAYDFSTFIVGGAKEE
ncbi:ribonuclease Z [Listeria sp. PSOL-1]|uniref:ribonuclease Z n=1 Tax=Listeria sp. PSOL-1 TaxID=1844999 RepID=UPI0013D6DD24|nr:ribonuclease Z [Listeria sp. PSOL-1]